MPKLQSSECDCPNSPPPASFSVRSRRYSAGPTRNNTSPALYPFHCVALYMKRLVRLFACQRSASLLRTSALYAASSISTSKADCDRQPRSRDTERFTFVHKTTPQIKHTTTPACDASHCRLYSTHESIYEAAFAQPHNADKELDDELNEELDQELDQNLDEMGDAKSVASGTSSGKRKRTPGPAFYAVRIGRTPGVYYSWSDYEAQTKGMKSECELFLSNRDPH